MRSHHTTPASKSAALHTAIVGALSDLAGDLTGRDGPDVPLFVDGGSVLARECGDVALCNLVDALASTFRPVFVLAHRDVRGGKRTTGLLSEARRWHVWILSRVPCVCGSLALSRVCLVSRVPLGCESVVVLLSACVCLWLWSCRPVSVCIGSPVGLTRHHRPRRLQVSTTFLSAHPDARGDQVAVSVRHRRRSGGVVNHWERLELRLGTEGDGPGVWVRSVVTRAPGCSQAGAGAGPSTSAAEPTSSDASPAVEESLRGTCV